MNEQTTKPIASWDIKAAVGMAETVIERHNAKPYGFYFTERLSAKPVPDGEGGTLEVQEKEVKRSGIYHLGGELVTVDQVRKRADPKEKILLSNMECNDMPIVVQNRNSWLSTTPFNEEDFIVAPDGKIVERGDDPKHVAYRKKKIAEHEKQLAKMS